MSETTAPVESKKPAAAAAKAAKTEETAKGNGALSLREESKMATAAAVGSVGRRPIEPSQLTVASTFRSVGSDRPIFASQLQTVGDFYSSGVRPIGASAIQVSQTYSVMGNRPVASNEIDDPATLMGFID